MLHKLNTFVSFSETVSYGL